MFSKKSKPKASQDASLGPSLQSARQGWKADLPVAPGGIDFGLGHAPDALAFPEPAFPHPSPVTEISPVLQAPPASNALPWETPPSMESSAFTEALAPISPEQAWMLPASETSLPLPETVFSLESAPLLTSTAVPDFADESTAAFPWESGLHGPVSSEPSTDFTDFPPESFSAAPLPPVDGQAMLGMDDLSAAWEAPAPVFDSPLPAPLEAWDGSPAFLTGQAQPDLPVQDGSRDILSSAGPEIQSMGGIHPDSLASGAFLDTINDQLYPPNPLHSEYAVGEQAFEEAAQFLFPETMAAPLDWQADASLLSFPEDSSAGDFGLEMPSVLDLGQSYPTETRYDDSVAAAPDGSLLAPSVPEPVAFTDLAPPPLEFGLNPSLQAAPIDAFDPPPSFDLPTREAPVPSLEMPLSALQPDDFEKLAAENQAVEGFLLSHEPLGSDLQGTHNSVCPKNAEPTAFSDEDAFSAAWETVDSDYMPDAEWFSEEELAEEHLHQVETGKLPGIHGSLAAFQANLTSESLSPVALNIPLPAHEVDTEEIALSLGESFSDFELPLPSEVPENSHDLLATWTLGLENALPANQDAVAAPPAEGSADALSLGEAPLPSSDLDMLETLSPFDPTEALERMPDLPESSTSGMDTLTAEEEALLFFGPVEDNAFESLPVEPETPSASPLLQTFEGFRQEADSQSPSEELLSEALGDQDFYAPSFTLNAEGELVPDYLGEGISIIPEASLFASQAESTPAVPSLLKGFPISDTETPPLESIFGNEGMISPAESDFLRAKEVDFLPSKPFSGVTPGLFSDEKQAAFQAQPETWPISAANEAVVDSHQALEAQWESPVAPLAQEIPLPPRAAEIDIAENLEVLGLCDLGSEKRLLVVRSENGPFALMGQSGAENPQVSVLKLFEQNPLAFQKTFTAVEEAQAASQGMFVVQIGTWHGIVSVFQNQISLHTELG